MEEFSIKAFKAVDEPILCQKFHEGHTKVLTDYGIVNLNTAEPEWMSNDNVYVVVAINTEDEVVGGLRVHKYAGDKNIPLIDALFDLDSKILDLFEDSMPKGTAEVCGLWNSRKIFGKGISPLLCVCSVVVVKSIGLNDFYCFSAPYTEKMIKTNGCIDVTEIGNQGRFHYPTEEYISVVLYNPDVDKLEFADDYNRNRIAALLENPTQTFIEKGGRAEIVVNYSLMQVSSTPELI